MSGAGAADQGGERPFAVTHAAAGSGDQAAAAAPSAVPGDDARADGLLPLGVSPIVAAGPGRPKGAKNRRTDLVAQYLVDRFGDPLTASMSVAGKPLRELVRDLREVASDCGMKLGASVMDIARFQRECRNDALPYIHAKRAPETFKGEALVPILAVGRFEAHTTIINGAARSMEDVLEMTANKVEPDQGLSGDAAAVSHGEKSHD